MKKNIRKMMTTSLLALTLAGAGGSIVSAGLWSYSHVQSGVYEHSATANGAFSGWKRPGVEARASKYIRTGTAQCYWNCR